MPEHEIRLDQSAEFDELVVDGSAFVHVERMDQRCFWIGIDLPDNKRINIRTGVEDGMWFFRVEEDFKEGRDFLVERRACYRKHMGATR